METLTTWKNHLYTYRWSQVMEEEEAAAEEESTC